MIDDSHYDTLFNFLEQRRWREADQETYRLMLEICDRTSQGWLRSEDILDFPCVELRTIDGLWFYHSNQKFGFKVQQLVYAKLKEKVYNEGQIWQKFATQVGWCREDKWLAYPELTFHLAAPLGHLPRYVTLHIGFGIDSEKDDFWGTSLFSRLEHCEQNPDDWIETLVIEDDEE